MSNDWTTLLHAGAAFYAVGIVLFLLALPILQMCFAPRAGYVVNIIYANIIVIASIALCGPRLIQFWDSPSFVWVYGLTAGFILGSGQGRLFAQGIHGAVTGNYSSENAPEIAAFFQRLFYALIVIGLLGTMLGGILMLSDLDPATIGSGCAVALLPLFYAIFFGLVFILPVAAGFRKHVSKIADTTPVKTESDVV